MGYFAGFAGLQTLAAFALPISITLIALPLWITRLRRSEHFDIPGSRSLHSVATPRGTGLVQALALMVTFALIERSLLPLVFVMCGFALLGALDDYSEVSVASRLTWQLVLGLAGGYAILYLGIEIAIPTILAMALTALVVSLMVNITNFMDGINGLSGVQGTIMGLTFGSLLLLADRGTYALIGIATAASCVGILPWNGRARARVFPGDSGSYLIGASIGLLILVTWVATDSILIALAPATLYIADVVVTLIRGLITGRSLVTPHRDHRYQRMVIAGASPRYVVALIGSLTTVIGLVAVTVQLSLLPTAVLIATCGLCTAIYFLVPLDRCK